MANCRTCKFFGYDADGEESGPHSFGGHSAPWPYTICGRLEVADLPSDMDQAAFVMTRKEAALCVTEDFGCELHDPASE